MLPGIAALKIQGFRNLWIGQTLSQLGDAIYMLVFLFMAKEISGSSEIVAVIGTLQAIPFLVIGPYAGVLADRLDRRKIMVAADLASAVALALLAVVLAFDATPPIWVIGAAGFILSCINSCFMPARTAAIPSLVPEDRLVEANSLAMATQQLMAMLGLAFSATVLGAIYVKMPDWFFFTAVILNAASFLGSLVFIAKLPALAPDTSPDAAQKQSLREVTRKTMADLKDGLAAMRKDPVTRVGLPINAVTNLFVSGFMIVYLEVNDKWYGGKFTTMAWMEFSFGFAMVIASIFAGKLNLSRVGLLFSLATALLAVLIGLMGFAKPYWLFVALNVLCGLCLPIGFLPLITYLQAGFPVSMRGRVASAWTMVSMGTQPIGMMAAGYLIPLLGITGFFVFIGGGMLLGGLYGLAHRQFRETQMPSLGPETEQPA